MLRVARVVAATHKLALLNKEIFSFFFSAFFTLFISRHPKWVRQPQLGSVTLLSGLFLLNMTQIGKTEILKNILLKAMLCETGGTTFMLPSEYQNAIHMTYIDRANFSYTYLYYR